MMGVERSEPYTPPLEMVNVPPAHLIYAQRAVARLLAQRIDGLRAATKRLVFPHKPPESVLSWRPCSSPLVGLISSLLTSDSVSGGQ